MSSSPIASSPSNSTTSSDTDASPPRTPHTRVPFPSRAFANAMTIPLKSPPSPPSTITVAFSELAISSSSSESMSPLSNNTSYANCAYPSWPKSDSLSSNSSISSSPFPNFGAYTGGHQASSYISDEDLLDLATLPLYNNIRIPREFLVAATPVQDEKRRPRSRRVVLPEAVSQGKTDNSKRRSGPLKRRKAVPGLSPVVERGE